MATHQMIVLFVLNSILVIFVAGQTELLEQDVEIISGRHTDRLADPSNPLDAKFAGQLGQNIYAPPVSSVQCGSGDVSFKFSASMSTCNSLAGWLVGVFVY